MTRRDEDSSNSGAPSGAPPGPSPGTPQQAAAPGRPGPGRARQKEIYLQGLAGRRSPISADLTRLEAEAREVMDKRAFAYVAGGAGTESTMDANRDAFRRWRIVPRVLRGTAERDLTVELFGRQLPAPLLLAPIGVLDLAHPDGDLATARAAAAAGLPMIFSSQASVPMEDCAAAMGDAPRWFQLYWSESDELTESLVTRAARCGCEAIVLTLDTTLLGWRPRDLDLGYLPFLHGRGIAQYTSDPTFRARLDEPLGEAVKPPLAPGTIAAALSQVRRYPGTWKEKLSGAPRAAVQRFIATYSRPGLAWEDLPRLRQMTGLPIVLKGVLHPDDARRAVDLGMDAVLVSNHGGRQVDGAVASLDALPPVVDAVAGRVPVLFDSGIRSGADALKALALGARAVCLGRPWVYALALAGEHGVREALSHLVADLDLTLGLTGCPTLADLGPEHLVRTGDAA